MDLTTGAAKLLESVERDPLSQMHLALRQHG
jgi:hypothetical protein